MEDTMTESFNQFKDDSRPAFIRLPYTVGIYLDALDARPDKDINVGSHHAFMMEVMDQMFQHFKTLDLSQLKGHLLARRAAEGMILEGFRSGCVLAVTFDTLDAVDNLWTLYIKGKLTPIFQDLLVDQALLKATKTVKISLRSKLWEDEYKSCLNEITTRSTVRQRLSSFENDFKMVCRIKQSQQNMPGIIAKAREHESQFERNLGEFMLTLKRTLPPNMTVLKNLKEFSTNIRVAKGIKKTGFESVDQFLKALEFFRQTFAEIEKQTINPLCQVRAVCEHEKQVEFKKQIRDSWAEMTSLLKQDSDLSQAKYKDWERKVLKMEHALFFGLISLIPLSLDRLTTIDVSTDEYIMAFPEMAE
ncbi:uncharacterized protein LOC129923626 isoform X2 [Biomphalaria glabrata]|nr:uncharacterized protein LOC129923626 isoform X2 [Biomphalaria glabrata]XP_055871500.1 uncharacterized protein LOC129923626 isoform X2 [Biomphalaria glabrata]XP_055871501.1 uncharacterized protein LOC129923626 isoform X2 [Biomphalaria glabrata]XP_055871502.1 uncharacterized protein LOC129923626 isoform X2 [Biomphalaria glabrata]